MKYPRKGRYAGAKDKLKLVRWAEQKRHLNLQRRRDWQGALPVKVGQLADHSLRGCRVSMRVCCFLIFLIKEISRY